MTAFSRLVVGCSKQLPNDLLAYRLVGSSAGGRVMLSRRGVSYSADPRELSDYRELVDEMLTLVLASVPPGSRTRAREALIRRWNRDWGVEAEDVVGLEAETRYEQPPALLSLAARR
jgi:hypothetical protein